MDRGTQQEMENQRRISYDDPRKESEEKALKKTLTHRLDELEKVQEQTRMQIDLIIEKFDQVLSPETTVAGTVSHDGLDDPIMSGVSHRIEAIIRQQAAYNRMLLDIADRADV